MRSKRYSQNLKRYDQPIKVTLESGEEIVCHYLKFRRHREPRPYTYAFLHAHISEKDIQVVEAALAELRKHQPGTSVSEFVSEALIAYAFGLDSLRKYLSERDAVDLLEHVSDKLKNQLLADQINSMAFDLGLLERP